MKTSIIYHKSDLDGVASAAVAVNYVKRRNEEYELIPYSYECSVKDVLTKTKDSDTIYVLDVSFGSETESVFRKWMDEGKCPIWIDHHKGIIEDSMAWDFTVIGVRKVGVAACALASEFLTGEVPEIIRYLSDYDVWDKGTSFGWDNVMAMQYAIRTIVGLDVRKMICFLDSYNANIMSCADLLLKGKTVISYLDMKNEDDVKSFSFVSSIDGVGVVAMNTTNASSRAFSSLKKDWLDSSRIKAFMPFSILSNGLVRFSLYAREGEDVDCCEICKRFGGGGHAGAAGFTLKMYDKRIINFFEKRRLWSDE